MNPKVKKGIIIGASVIAFVFVLLLTTPFLFKDKILKVAKQEINNMINAEVDFKELNLSFIRNFPNATIELDNVRVIGTNEFAKDTLFSSENIRLVVNLKSLFSDEGYDVRNLEFNNSNVKLHVLPDGKVNWNIMKDTSEVDTTASKFHFKLRSFKIKAANLAYIDEESNMRAIIKNLNHTTSGDFTADSSLLVTHTTIDSLTFTMDKIDYISKANVLFDADINANLNDMIFSFSKNSSRINEIAFSLEGWVKSLEDGWGMDLTLNAKDVDFKSILSMIPAIYANSFSDIKAGGKVDLKGYIKGNMVGDYYPAFSLGLNVVNGWFQYPSLPKSLKNINVNAKITNPGKTLDETVVDISRFSFLLGANPFNLQLRLATPMSDPDMTLKAVGKLNLGDVKDFYPLGDDMKLNGLLDVNLALAGKMSYYDNNMYDKFKFSGKLDVSNMLVDTKSLPQKVSITNANLIFNNRYVDLTGLDVKIGRNDISATGKLENFVAYALHDKTLKGQLTMQSNYFNVSDFMTEETTGAQTSAKNAGTQSAASDTASVIEIPKNIDFTLNAGFKQFVYDKMNFTNAKGTLKVLDGELNIQNMAVNAFGGSMLMNGLYSTKEPSKPKVDFNLNIQEVAFTEIFSQVEMLQKMAPIFKQSTGKFSTKIAFNSLLKKDMMPDLATLVGGGNLSTQSVVIKDVPAVTALAKALKREDLSTMNIKNLALNFDIKDGRVTTKPFDFKVSDVKFNMGGSTGLDQTMAYTGNVTLPSKLKLGAFSTVGLKIGGTFTKPKVAIDLTNTVNTAVQTAKTQVKAEVTKQVDNAKAKALEEARQQKANALKAANAEADKLRTEAKKAGDQLIAEAQNQGNELVKNAKNPIAKKAAEIASKKMVQEAQKKADQLNKKADEEAKKVIQKAESSVAI